MQKHRLSTRYPITMLHVISVALVMMLAPPVGAAPSNKGKKAKQPAAKAAAAPARPAEPAAPAVEKTEHAAIPVVENPLSLTDPKFVPYQVSAGATTELTIDLSLVEHYHAYLDRFKIRVLHPETIKVDKPRLSPVIQFMDAVSKAMKDGIENSAVLKATVEIPSGLTPGEHEAEFELVYQACTVEHCLFPKTIPVKAKFEILAPPAATLADTGATDTATPSASVGPAATATSTEGQRSGFEQAMQKGIFFAFLFVFFGGILTSLTPCVYPMIPITLAVIGARTKGQTRAKSFTLSVSYVLGIATTYSLLGVVAASTGAMFGSALSNVYVVTAIALLFTAMGLSMYGLFEIQAPAFIRDKLGSRQTGTGFTGAYATGLISGIVASPCIGPVLVTILAWIAQTGNKALGFGLLFTFAMGMGILLILLGTFSHMLNKVPKGGHWMEMVKFTFGTAMVGMALYYVAPLYPQWLFHALLAIALVLIASAYGAFEVNEGLSGLGRMRKGAMIVTFIIGISFALSAVFDRAGIQLIPAGSANVAGVEGGGKTVKLAWQPYSDELVQQANQAGKPVLIDFFAEWCGACKELEHKTFPDSRIRELSEKFTLLKIDATTDSDELQRLKAKYMVVGLPTLVFIDISGKVRDDLRVTGFEEADAFVPIMKRALTTGQTAAND